MLKRILALLGETPSSECARRYALRLARNSNAGITGVAGIDLRYINSSMVGGIGSIAGKAKLEKKLRSRADESRKRLYEVFRSECQAESTEFDLLSFEGDPTESLCSAAETHDLIITGHDTAFRGGVREQFSDTVAALLSMVPRPLIICPDEATTHDHVLVAYDGSLPAMRAVQMFTLLEVGKGKITHVTSVEKDSGLASKKIDTVTSFLRSHGCELDGNFAIVHARPAYALKRKIAEQSIGTLVMGAYGRRGLRNFLFGSTTRMLVQNPPCALFVYH